MPRPTNTESFDMKSATARKIVLELLEQRCWFEVTPATIRDLVTITVETSDAELVGPFLIPNR